MKNTAFRWFLVVILILLISPAYAWIQGYVAFLIIPLKNALLAKSGAALGMVFIFTGLIGAILTGLVTALPCGYLARRNPVLLAMLMVVSALCIPLYVTFTDSEGLNRFLIIVRTSEFVSIVASCIIFSVIGVRLSQMKSL